MECELTNEFYEVREAAFSSLRTGTFLSPQRGVRVCQLLELPSFENPFSWDVVSASARKGRREMRLFRACWRCDQGVAAFGTPVERQKHARSFRPTIEADFVPICSQRTDALLAQIQSVRVPLAVPDFPIGLDGVSYEFAVGGPFCHSRLAWWQELPDEWRELEPIFAELKTFFEETWQAARQNNDSQGGESQ